MLVCPLLWKRCELRHLIIDMNLMSSSVGSLCKSTTGEWELMGPEKPRDSVCYTYTLFCKIGWGIDEWIGERTVCALHTLFLTRGIAQQGSVTRLMARSGWWHLTGIEWRIPIAWFISLVVWILGMMKTIIDERIPWNDNMIHMPTCPPPSYLRGSNSQCLFYHPIISPMERACVWGTS